MESNQSHPSGNRVTFTIREIFAFLLVSAIAFAIWRLDRNLGFLAWTVIGAMIGIVVGVRRSPKQARVQVALASLGAAVCRALTVPLQITQDWTHVAALPEPPPMWYFVVAIFLVICVDLLIGAVIGGVLGGFVAYVIVQRDRAASTNH